MQKMTLTEQVLARTWMATPDDRQTWSDRHAEFALVARVLDAEGCPAGAALYRDAADMAMIRSTYKMRMPRSTVEEVAA
jgi:hypothetical protein